MVKIKWIILLIIAILFSSYTGYPREEAFISQDTSLFKRDTSTNIEKIFGKKKDRFDYRHQSSYNQYLKIKDSVLLYEHPFQNLKFIQPVSFEDVVFLNDADFESAKFNNDASFKYAHFNQASIFSNCNFGIVDFYWSDFSRYAEFNLSNFSRAASFFETEI